MSAPLDLRPLQEMLDREPSMRSIDEQRICGAYASVGKWARRLVFMPLAVTGPAAFAIHLVRWWLS